MTEFPHARILDARIHHAAAELHARARVTPKLAAIAPGRVNIVGEHVDYAGGVVLPFAIDRACVAVAAPSNALQFFALDLNQEWSFAAASDMHATKGSWQSYIQGVLTLAADVLAARNIRLHPMSVAITSTVPRGSGLSSSAALTVAIAKAVEGVHATALFDDPLELARLCQHAERNFAGVPCGIMDHAASVLGQHNRAIVLSCREPNSFHYTSTPSNLAWLVVDSGVSRSLAVGNYAALRNASDHAAQTLGVQFLWDATEEDLNAFAQNLTVPQRRAATHALGERNVLHALATADVAALKRELNASHQSLRDVLQVSCPELDHVVASAQRLGAGARLVGAGFGGCALVAVESPMADRVAAAIRDDFARRFALECNVIAVTPSNGARVVDLA